MKLQIAILPATAAFGLLAACNSESADTSDLAANDTTETENGLDAAEPLPDSGYEMQPGAYQLSGRVVEFDYVDAMLAEAQRNVRVGMEFTVPETRCLTEEAAADIGSSDFFIPSPECTEVHYDVGEGGIHYHFACVEDVMGGMASNLMEGDYGEDGFSGAATIARQFDDGSVGRLVMQVRGRRVGECRAN